MRFNQNKSRKRLWLLLSLFLVAGALGMLIFNAFNDALVYFYTPTEILEQSETLAGQRVRIGAMVQEGSLKKVGGSLKLRFMATDGNNQVPVHYEGVVPDLFREGQGVVAEGVWYPGKAFEAQTILAKHSEDYMPIEMSEEGMHQSRESLLKSLQ